MKSGKVNNDFRRGRPFISVIQNEFMWRANDDAFYFGLFLLVFSVCFLVSVISVCRGSHEVKEARVKTDLETRTSIVLSK